MGSISVESSISTLDVMLSGPAALFGFKFDSNFAIPLQNGGLLHSDPVEKANILNNQFQSSFSEKTKFPKTDFQKRCNMTNTSYPTMQDLNIVFLFMTGIS
jgi:hypothetical protein